MGGGYAHDVDAIVQIHANTILEAARWTTKRGREEFRSAGEDDRNSSRPLFSPPQRDEVKP